MLEVFHSEVCILTYYNPWFKEFNFLTFGHTMTDIIFKKCSLYFWMDRFNSMNDTSTIEHSIYVW